MNTLRLASSPLYVGLPLAVWMALATVACGGGDNPADPTGGSGAEDVVEDGQGDVEPDTGEDIVDADDTPDVDGDVAPDADVTPPDTDVITEDTDVVDVADAPDAPDAPLDVDAADGSAPTDVEDVADTPDLVEDTDVDGPVNLCGGTGVLLFDGIPGRPGDACGCGGRVICDGAEDLQCVGAVPENACGGCLSLPARVAAPCGECGDGEWVCDGEARLRCDGGSDETLCGGCTPLPGDPGFLCDSDEGAGVWVCETAESLFCIGDGRNACGGLGRIEFLPGTPCGECFGGRYVCAGRDEVVCSRPDRWVNECGGCGTLPAPVGDSCGCGGTWACDPSDPNRLTCLDSQPNACGGCDALEGEPGDACETGVWFCVSPDRVSCGGVGINVCGGLVPLAELPGRPCGPCNTGVTVCASPTEVICAGSQGVNACGTCSGTDGEPGESCGRGAIFACEDDTLQCVPEPGRNICGGTATLPSEPGAACGACGLGVVGCDGDDATACVGVPDDAPTFFGDADGDGFGAGAPFTLEVCDPLPAGVSAVDGDCDDADEDIRPSAVEVCDGVDNNCDENVDEEAANASCGEFGVCVDGACALGPCPTGFDDCDGDIENGCETDLTQVETCGSCDTSCSVTDGTPACVDGECAIAACSEGRDDCDGLVATGCEADLTSTADCGECGNACDLANASAVCEAGGCRIGTCDNGWLDCDGQDSNGCEVELGTDTDCADCGDACTAAGGAAFCGEGVCQLGSCEPGFEDCDARFETGCETALNTLTDCGECAAVCARTGATATCASGACAIASCNPGLDNCDSLDANGCETSLTTLSDCGGCDVVCDVPGASETCASGSCAIVSCEPGFDDCNEQLNDGCELAVVTVDNCGACGNVCSFDNASPTCNVDTCEIASCDAGWDDCNGNEGDGCEADITGDANCGGCGVTCDAWEYCDGTGCVPDVAVEMAGVAGHVCAVFSSGKVQCWGQGLQGALGTGTTADRSTPFRFPLSTRLVDVAAGSAFTCVLDEAGQVSCVGSGSVGQMGRGDTLGSTVVRPISGAADFTDISAGTSHVCGRRSSGSVACWGANDNRQLGDGTTDTRKLVPTPVSGLTDATDIECGTLHCCAIRQNDSVVCWGYNNTRQLADGTTTSRNVPVPVALPEPVVQLGLGASYSCALDINRQIWCWGQYPGSVSAVANPVVVDSEVVSMVAGDTHMCRRSTAGEMGCWGNNTSGRLGDGTTQNRTLPAPALTASRAPLPTFDVGAVGEGWTCYASDDGAVRCTGVGTLGAVGDGQIPGRVERLLFERVIGLGPTTSERGRCFDGLDNDGDGAVDCADTECAIDLGSRLGEELGSVRMPSALGNYVNGTCDTSDGPEQVFTWTAPATGSYTFDASNGNLGSYIHVRQGTCTGIERACDSGAGSRTGAGRLTLSVVAGQRFVIILDTDFSSEIGEVSLAITGGPCTSTQLNCDGSTSNGCETDTLGDELNCGGCGITCEQGLLCIEGGCVRETPVQVAGGASHFCAVANSGKVWCWGWSGNGQLGNFSTISRSAPVRAGLLTDAVEVAVSDASTCARRSSGRVACWGAGNLGQLGNGRASNVPSPVDVEGIDDAIQIVAGGTHFCALRSDRSVWCWGANSSGQLGNGTTTNAQLPVRVDLTLPVAEIGAGASHTCARLETGAVRCWGLNNSRQVGDGTTAGPRLVPTAVTGVANAVELAIGDNFSCARLLNRDVFCWGIQPFLTSGTSNPTRQIGSVDRLWAGGSALALHSDGVLYTLGESTQGQLGQGTLVGSNVIGRPLRYEDLLPLGLATDVAVADDTTCFIIDQHIRCAGIGTNGRLGDNQTVSYAYQTIPMRVAYLGPESNTERHLCYDGRDNDADGNVDGDDTDCAISLDSRLGVDLVTVNVTDRGGNFTSASCDATSDAEQMFRWVAPSTGSFTFDVGRSTALTTVFVREGTIDGPELGCNLTSSTSGYRAGGQLTLSVNAGDVLFIGVEPRDIFASAVTTLSIFGGACTATQVDCDGGIAGCESDILSNPRHCGACGVVCGGFSSCVAGACVPEPVTAVSTGQNSSCVRSENGLVWCWGFSNVGQTGRGDNGSNSIGPVPGLYGVTALEVGAQFVVALDEDGGVWTWGQGNSGQLGDGLGTNRLGPARLRLLGSATRVAAGPNHACALLENDEVWCWGSNTSSQLGDGTTRIRYLPVRVPGLTGVVDLALGDSFTCALRGTGVATCWGLNSQRQLGDGTTVPQTGPVTTVTVTGLRDIEAAGNWACGIQTGTDALYCWGNSPHLTSGSVSPTVIVPSGVRAIAGANGHMCAISTAGGMTCWGVNSNGELGNGLVATSRTPVASIDLRTGSPLANVETVSCGDNNTCLTRTDGTVWCTGVNSSNQLGDRQVATPQGRAGFFPLPDHGVPPGETGLCNDGIDNDQDGSVDCADSNCAVSIGSAVGTSVASFVTDDLIGNYATPVCLATTSYDQTWNWVAPSAGTYVFSSSSPTVDTAITVRSGACGSVERGCDSNNGGTTSESVTVTAQSGESFLITVDTVNGTAQGGTVNLNISGP